MRRPERKMGGNGARKEYEPSPRIRRCCGTREEEDEKESIANRILADAERKQSAAACEGRAYSEAQLKRKDSRCVIRLDEIADNVLSIRPPQTWIDELKFLASVSDLTQRERFFLRGWMLGWTQEESRIRWMEAAGYDGRQTVSRVLKAALYRCCSNSEIAFRVMTRHPLYRRPRRGIRLSPTLTCRYCREPYIIGYGDGIFCSTGCRSAYALTRG